MNFKIYTKVPYLIFTLSTIFLAIPSAIAYLNTIYGDHSDQIAAQQFLKIIAIVAILLLVLLVVFAPRSSVVLSDQGLTVNRLFRYPAMRISWSQIDEFVFESKRSRYKHNRVPIKETFYYLEVRQKEKKSVHLTFHSKDDVLRILKFANEMNIPHNPFPKEY